MAMSVNVGNVKYLGLSQQKKSKDKKSKNSGLLGMFTSVFSMNFNREQGSPKEYFEKESESHTAKMFELSA